MKRVTALALCLSATTAGAEVVADLHRCIDDIDRRVSDMQSQPLDKRILELNHYAEDESRCFSQLSALCMLNEPSEPCLESMLSTLGGVLQATVAGLPDDVKGEGKMQANYRMWLEKMRNGDGMAPTSACSLPANYPRQACAVLATSTAVIDARSWQRNLDILAKAQEQAEN